MNSVEFFLQLTGSPFKMGPEHLISRAHILSPDCKGTVGGEFLSISASRMGGELCLTRWKIPDAGFFAFTFVLLESPVCNPQKDFIRDFLTT